MKQEFIDKMKGKLLQMRAEIYDSLAKKNEDFKGLVNAVESGDECDIASDAIDRTMLDSLGQQDANRLELVEKALNRISQGKYGVCFVCGKDIPMARLESIPWTGMCVECKSKSEKNNR